MSLLHPTRMNLPPNYSMFDALPTETITEIMAELDWFSLMNIRKTCHYLYDVSKSLAVWQRQLRQYLRCHRYSPRLEAPLDTFSAPELEDWVTRRISADAGWKSANTRPTQIRKIDLRVSQACLVPGGRWLLLGSGSGTVLVFDLDAPDVQGRMLFQLPNNGKIEFMCLSIDGNSADLAFKVAITANDQFFRDDSIHIWAVRIYGRGREARLQAVPLHSFDAPSTSNQVFNMTLRDDLVARIMHHGNSTCHIDVFNWRLSSTVSDCRQVILPEKIVHHIQLLPDNRLLVFSEDSILVFDVEPVIAWEPSSPVCTPRWRLPCPPGDRTAHGGISQASIDSSCTRFTFVAENPDTVYGLSIPHDSSHTPIVSTIAPYPGKHYPAVALGLEKMFVAYERNWRADRDHLSGSTIRLGIAWSEDGTSSTPDPANGVHSYEYPTDWYANWPPLLDEGSGRIVQCFGKKGLLVLDTALCFTV